MSEKDFLEGRQAADHYYNSQGFGGLTRYVDPADAIKLFHPPVSESMAQISTPMPKPRKDWIAGFAERQKEILYDE